MLTCEMCGRRKREMATFNVCHECWPWLDPDQQKGKLIELSMAVENSVYWGQRVEQAGQP